MTEDDDILRVGDYVWTLYGSMRPKERGSIVKVVEVHEKYCVVEYLECGGQRMRHTFNKRISDLHPACYRATEEEAFVERLAGRF